MMTDDDMTPSGRVAADIDLDIDGDAVTHDHLLAEANKHHPAEKRLPRRHRRRAPGRRRLDLQGTGARSWRRGPAACSCALRTVMPNFI